LPEIASLAAPLKADEPVRVAVVGTITAVKGSDRLLDCAADALDRGLPLEFHVIGSTNKDAVFRRLRNVHITGRYRQHEVYSRLAAARCHVAFLPSLWPETFMYTLSTVMASGLYTVCFDIGAQSSRLKQSGWGRVIPLDAGPVTINNTLLAAARQVAIGPPAPSPPPSTSYQDMLGAYYGFSAEERARFIEKSTAVRKNVASKPHWVPRKNNARIH
jgi:glycosyltransferase involved in cell wall biosynthesis